MKRILAMLLALTMTLVMLGSFTGCGIVRLLLKEKKTELVADNEEIDGLLGLLPDDNEKLVGTWKADVDFTGYVKEGFERSEAGEMAGYFTFSELTIGIVLEFTDEGTFRMWIDPDSIDDLSEKMKTQMEAGLTLYFEDTIREQGLDMTVEELLQASETSMDELLAELDFETIVGSVPEELASGKYDAQDGKLYTSVAEEYNIDYDVYEPYALSGKTFTLLDPGTENSALAGLYPVEFKKAG